MANNVTVGGATIATQDVGGIQHQKVKATGATAAIAAAVTINNDSSSADIAANANRRSVVIRNTGLLAIEISPTASFAWGNGFPLAVGEGIATDYTGALYFITQSGTGAIRYWEDANQ